MGNQRPSVDPIVFLFETADELIPAHITGKARFKLQLQIVSDIENGNPEIAAAIETQLEKYSQEADALYERDPEFRASVDRLTRETMERHGKG